MDIHLDKFLDKISNLLAFINFKIDINTINKSKNIRISDLDKSKNDMTI
jgi:hypothetical protein